MITTELLKEKQQETHVTAAVGYAAVAEAELDDIVYGTGKCMVSGCSCPSYVDPPGGFSCRRCGHPMSEHW